MKKVAITNLNPGMKLAKDVYVDGNRLLLMSGIIMKPSFIRKLELFDVAYVFVDESYHSSPVDIREERVYKEAFNTVKSVLTSVGNGKDLDVHAVKQTVDEIVHHVIGNEEIYMQLAGIRDIDNYTFMHSVDVCIYSVITGRDMGLPKEDIFELAVGSLLHDIGKCKVPLDILQKPGRLTEEEFEIIKQHTLNGYEILNNTPGITKRISNVALQHHERWDGTGYPLALKGYEIDEFSRIVTIADIYDAIVSERVYKTRKLPHEAASFIAGKSSIYVDPNIVPSFINNVAVYPRGSIVLLNSGEIGNIVEINKNLSVRPKVQVIARKEGPPIFDPYELNLAENKEVYIVDILG